MVDTARPPGPALELPPGWPMRAPIPALLAVAVFPPSGTDVDLAVSGGADSTALLALAVAAGLGVSVHHVDHGLRPSSGVDAAAVVELAARFGVPAIVHRAELVDGPDLEARARQARRRLLPSGALCGHTADDQAETLLLALLRGAGPDGAAAMSSATHPLLAIRRRDTRAVCDALGLTPLDDPTNADPRFRRNRVRHELLPLLAEVAGRDVVPLLARFAALQRDTVAALDRRLEGVDPTDVAGLGDLDDLEVGRVLRRWWRAVTGHEHAPDRAATARMVQVVRGVAPRCDVTSGWCLSRRAGRLTLERRPSRVEGAHRKATT